LNETLAKSNFFKSNFLFGAKIFIFEIAHWRKVLIAIALRLTPEKSCHQDQKSWSNENRNFVAGSLPG
jgi:hypothetical protein